MKPIGDPRMATGVRAVVMAVGLAAAAAVSGQAAEPGSGAADPTALLAEIAASKLDPARAVALTRVKLDIGLANLQFDQGTLFPATPVGGKTVELVFQGKGKIRLQPPDAIESQQLELFTGQPRLDEEFKEAVLVVARDAVVKALLGKAKATPESAVTGRAETLFAEWQKRPERKILGVDTAILFDSLDEVSAQGFFLALFRGGRRGDFLMVIDPAAREQLTLGRFVPIDATEREKRKIAKEMSKQQRKGRLVGLEVEDLGQWDTWVSASLAGPDGKPRPGGANFEPTKYTLDTTLTPGDLRLKGKARIELETMLPGSRALELNVNSDLQVRKVTDGRGAPLFFRQTQGQITVLLPAPAAATDSPVVALEYDGKIVEKDFNLYRLTDTERWYPHAGEIDRALYDATFRWPKGLDLVASGERVEGGESGELAWERRTLPVRAFGASFEIGHFRRQTAQAGHVKIDFAFGNGSAFTGTEVREQIVNTAVDALQFYEQTFGPYPLDTMTVATANRGFSQGNLSFVTLSDFLLNNVLWNQWLDVRDRRAVLAHELAHQWWGNLVGWTSYRDQWISEAMASYSSLLYTGQKLKGQKLPGGEINADWLGEVSAGLADGRPMESVGPIVLGPRLSSSLAPGAYQPIVYQKGSVVLNMLALILGEENFPKMLKQVVKVAANNTISTEDFLAILARVSSADLEGFAGQYVFGTGLPVVQYSYDFKPKAGGGWTVEGSARQLPSYVHRYRVVRSANGALDVLREGVPRGDVAKALMMVPIELETFDPKEGKGKGWLGANGATRGNLPLRGEVSPFSVPVEIEPKRLWFDRKGRVYGSFFDATRVPGYALLAQGRAAAALGRTAEAEKLFQQAEEAKQPPLDTKEDLDWLLPGWLRKALKPLVELSRARLLLDQGKDLEAAGALDRAENGELVQEEEVEILRARLDLHRAAPEKAYRRLKKAFLGDSSCYGSVEGCTLLAIAAQATDHKEEGKKAEKMARDWGVDLKALEGAAP